MVRTLKEAIGQPSVIQRVEAPKVELPIYKPKLRRSIDTIDKKSYRIVEDAKLLDKVNVSGNLNKLLIISPSQNFSLEIEADWKMVYEGTWSDYEELGLGIDEGDPAPFTIAIKNVTFNEKIFVRLICPAPVVFTRIYISTDFLGYTS